MSRPEHPGVPLPSSCLQALAGRQEAYDQDPEAYERGQAEEKARWEQQEQEYESRMMAEEEAGARAQAEAEAAESEANQSQP